MTKLEEARVLIDQIDLEMQKLFIKRMQASKMVAEYKKENHLEIYNEAREKSLIANNLESFPSEELKKYYLDFLNQILKISKDYQKDLM